MDEAFQECIQKGRHLESDMAIFKEDETVAFLDLMRRTLVFKPEQRFTIWEVLRSEWMVKWALPDFERTIGPSSAHHVSLFFLSLKEARHNAPVGCCSIHMLLESSTLTSYFYTF